jgi:hypothetical protein
MDQSLGRRMLLDSGYNLSAFPLAIPALVLAAVGLSLGAGLLVLGFGLLVLTATAYVARGFAHLERVRLRNLVGRRVPVQVYVVARDGDGPLRRLLTPLRDPQSWLDMVWMLVGWVTATAAFALTLAWWATAATGLSYWVWERFVPRGTDADNTTLAELLGLGDGRHADVLLNVGIGLVALVTLPLVARLAAATHGGLAGALLTTRADLMAERSARLAGSE